MIPAEVKPAGIARGGVKNIFRLMTEEDAKLKDLIEYAHLAEFIKRLTSLDYIIFPLNCAYTRLENSFNTGNRM